MPVGYVLVGNTRRHIKHDDAALAVDVVAITQTTELLLSCSVPNIKLDRAQILRVVLVPLRVYAVGGRREKGLSFTVEKPRG